VRILKVEDNRLRQGIDIPSRHGALDVVSIPKRGTLMQASSSRNALATQIFYSKAPASGVVRERDERKSGEEDAACRPGAIRISLIRGPPRGRNVMPPHSGCRLVGNIEIRREKR